MTRILFGISVIDHPHAIRSNQAHWGAKPYHQDYDRGVKLVGATAHHVTPDLDEAAIIEQEVIRIDHSHNPALRATAGLDAEALALSRAVRWHRANRGLLHGHRTGNLQLIR